MTAPLPKKPWKPRASAIGSYMRCELRALQDRLFHEGELPAEVVREESDMKSYASLGSCGHFTLQDGTRCLFAPRESSFVNFDRLLDPAAPLTEEERKFCSYADLAFDGDLDATLAAYKAGDPRIFQPLPVEWTNASELFGNDIALTREKVRATASLAASKMPTAPDGKPWICESSFENDLMTGHTDFWSQCGTVVGDLKTTSKPPNHGWIKYEHLAQLAGYHLLTGCTKSWILYVDSMRAAWATLIWVDWTRPGHQRYAQQVADYCKLLMSPAIFDVAIPRIGSHCSETWCPYRKCCYQDMMPPPGIVHDAISAKRPTGQLQWGGKVMG